MIDRFRGEFGFLSNFYATDIVVCGTRYPSVEHYYQAMKTCNAAARQDIVAASTPGLAKRLGGKIVLRPDWPDIKDAVMMQGLRKKFAPGRPLAQKLIATAPRRLVEGNMWHDRYWGDCRCGKCADGMNMLGVMLMQIRHNLMEAL